MSIVGDEVGATVGDVVGDDVELTVVGDEVGVTVGDVDGDEVELTVGGGVGLSICATFVNMRRLCVHLGLFIKKSVSPTKIQHDFSNQETYQEKSVSLCYYSNQRL